MRNVNNLILWIKETEIKELKELQMRLVADTVTGKIDVRNIKIPEYEFVEEETDNIVTDSENELETE